MSHKGWRRAIWGLVPVTLVATVLAIVGWAQWWQGVKGAEQKPLGWLEALSWVTSVLSLPVSIVLAVRANRRDGERPAGTDPVPAAAQADGPVRATAWKTRRVDRGPALQRLRDMLVDEPWGVVVVSGDRGIGKTRLVEEVVAKLPAAWRALRDGTEPRLFWHDVAPGAPGLLDLLIADLESLLDKDAALHNALGFGPGSPDRLKAALEALGGRPALIVADQAENLLNPVGELVDPELDEALEIIVSGQAHAVTVVLVSRVVPKSPARHGWPRVCPFPVGKLSVRHFAAYLSALDTERRGLRKAVGPYAGRFRGDLHLAELAYAVLALPGWNAPVLAERLRKAENVPRFLTDALLGELGPVGRRVLEALDAYGTAIDAEAVRALLAGKHPADEVTAALARLAESGIVRRTSSGQYDLPASGDDWSVEHAPDPMDAAARLTYFREVSEELVQRYVEKPRGLADLRHRFAELRARIRGDMPRWAYASLEDLDAELRRRNAHFLLREQREALRGRLVDDRLESANENALGELYAARGEFDRASEAYGRALEHAQARDDLRARTAIRANLAGLYWWRGDTGHAYGYYELVVDDCDELVRADPEHYGDLAPFRMGALEGMADCRRAWGRYDLALPHAKEALDLPGRPEFPDTEEVRDYADTHRVAIAMKVARWLTDLGRPDREADEYARIAERVATARDEDWLWASYLSAYAALWLRRGDHEQARMTADRALALARPYGDPVVLRQARATLGAAYLLADDRRLDEAARHVRNAAQYRDPPLDVRALRALVALAVPEDGARDAKALFAELHAATESRLARDQKDVMALYYQGFALCGLRLDTDDSLDLAVRTFGKARDRTIPPAPRLIDHLILLLERMEQDGGHPGRLQPVIQALSVARSQG